MYTETNWVNGETPLNAENMNKIEKGITGAYNEAGIANNNADEAMRVAEGANQLALDNGIEIDSLKAEKQNFKGTLIKDDLSGITDKKSFYKFFYDKRNGSVQNWVIEGGTDQPVTNENVITALGGFPDGFKRKQHWFLLVNTKGNNDGSLSNGFMLEIFLRGSVDNDFYLMYIHSYNGTNGTYDSGWVKQVNAIEALPPFVRVDNLPPATKGEYNKNLLYQQGNDLKFIVSKSSENPVTESKSTLKSSNTTIINIGSTVFSFVADQSVVKINLDNGVSEILENVKIPDNIRYCNMGGVIDNEIYLFKNNYIYKFNIENYQFTELSSNSGLTSKTSVYFNNNIYFIGGPIQTAEIFKYSKETNSLVRLPNNLFNGVGSTDYVVTHKGNKIYIFNYSGVGYAVVYDVITGETAYIADPVYKEISSSIPVNIKEKIYFCGGRNSNGNIVSNIYEYNIDTDSYKKLDIYLLNPRVNSNNCLQSFTIGNTGYIFGYSSNPTYETLTVGTVYEYKTLKGV